MSPPISIYDAAGKTGTPTDVLAYLTEVERVLDGRTPSAIERRNYLLTHLAREDRQNSTAVAPVKVPQAPPAEWMTALIQEVENEPIPVPTPDELLAAIVEEVENEPIDVDPFEDKPTTTKHEPLDPHRPGYVSSYYFVGYISPTVDGASQLRREHSMDEAPITRITLTYKQAQDLGLIR